MRKYVCNSGVERDFDDSVKACEPFGFLAGQRVNTPEGEATVIGVFDGDLWFHCDEDSGAVYWGGKTKKDFKKDGFTLIVPPVETK